MNYSQELAEFKAAINAKYDLHCSAFNSQDVDTVITSFFTPNALWVGHGYPERRGADELREMFMEVVKTGRVGHSSIQSFVSGDCGWDYCDWPVQPLEAGQSSWIFKSMFCWVRIDGEWFCNAVTCFCASEI